MHHPRQQHLVNSRVQSGLIACFLLAAMGGAVACAMAFWIRDGLFGEPRSLASQFGPFALALVVVVPLAAWIAVRATNRVVGPLIRIRHACRLVLEQRRTVPPIAFRENDPWHEFAEEFNELLDLVSNGGIAASATKEAASSEVTADEVPAV